MSYGADALTPLKINLFIIQVILDFSLENSKAMSCPFPAYISVDYKINNM